MPLSTLTLHAKWNGNHPGPEYPTHVDVLPQLQSSGAYPSHTMHKKKGRSSSVGDSYEQQGAVMSYRNRYINLFQPPKFR